MKFSPRLWFISLNILFFVVVLLVNNDSFLLRLIPSVKSGQAKVGRVVDVKGDVRKREHGDSLWLPVKTGDTVSDNELFFTAEKSNLKLTLKKGTEMMIHSDSLVGLGEFSKRRVVILSQGKIEAQSDSNEVIRIGNGIQETAVQLNTKPSQLASQDFRRTSVRDEAMRTAGSPTQNIEKPPPPATHSTEQSEDQHENEPTASLPPIQPNSKKEPPQKENEASEQKEKPLTFMDNFKEKTEALKDTLDSVWFKSVFSFYILVLIIGAIQEYRSRKNQ